MSQVLFRLRKGKTRTPVRPKNQGRRRETLDLNKTMERTLVSEVLGRVSPGRG